ncbi:hypothetical protein EV207_14019 [Scopulibacillus darangshiensis]|uniref:Uncharacterized protein n=1 Tax=Scopulibacillus darangshiensis TaxID=442528 RepID=A0A4R2NJR6_9BACL|nr:hypothetical protein EV207_14019 [Scopulibacillus darangshiensis]
MTLLYFIAPSPNRHDYVWKDAAFFASSVILDGHALDPT